MPLTLLGLRASHRYCAIELGMNHPGEIARLAEASFKQGVIKTDVTKEAADLFDDSLAKEIRGR